MNKEITLPSFLKVKRKYIIRHEMLKYLYSKAEYDDNHVIGLRFTLSTLNEISEKLKIPIEEITLFHHAFKEEATCTQKNGMHSMELTEKGIDYVVDEYWLREGEKELNERIYDKTKWSIPVLALILTVVSLIITTCTVVRTNKKVKSIEEELQNIRNEKAPGFQFQKPSF
jgi:hypothetical protein